MPGQVRAISTAGNNLRVSAGLSAEITAELANETEFIVQSAPTCVDGLNWYEIETMDGVSGWTAEGVDDTYWLAPSAFCTDKQREANTHYSLDAASGTVFGGLVDMHYVSSRKSLLISSLPPSHDKGVTNMHPARLVYHWFNLDTQSVTSAGYPYADIVTPALTDQLGITDYVFGDKSSAFYSLHVSPQRDRILYFMHNPPIQDCAHGCYTARAWVANTDGSDATQVGDLILGDAGYVDWDWGSNGRIYLTMIYSDSSYGVVEICDDGNCFNLSQETFPFQYAYPRVSPNGQYLTVVDQGNDIFLSGKQRLYQPDTRSWFDLPLDAWIAPAVWADDGQTIYYLAFVDDEIVLATTALADLSHADILTNDLGTSFGANWDIAPDLGMVFIGLPYYGLNIRCAQT
ncbi:MAG: SH3 domain-containing protein [Chloroflexota bacterium]